MNIKSVTIGLLAAVIAAGAPPKNPNATNGQTQMVITVLPVKGSPPENLGANDLMVLRGNTSAPILRLERLSGDLGGVQLFVLLDDSSRSSSLGIQLAELKKFLASLPASTQIGVGYMRNGAVQVGQAFTADHQKADRALRLPESVPGANGSPYFALSDLVKHWPSKESADRRAVLMLTDGVDPYYGAAIVDDPYVNTAIHEALKENVAVYSIYLRGAGLYGRNGWVTNIAQSRLIQVSEETGGYAYFQGFTDPVSISPFLKDFENRLDNQYRVTIEAWNEKGVQPVKVRTELPGLKIEAPNHIYVR